MKRKRKPEQYESNSRKERCMNPWNGECSSQDITLYIFYEGQRLPICRECWKAIAQGWPSKKRFKKLKRILGF